MEQHKGGYIKANNKSGEEDWSYFREGTLRVTEGEEKYGLSFKWNGESLVACKSQVRYSIPCRFLTYVSHSKFFFFQNGMETPITSGLTARWNGITLAYLFFFFLVLA